MIRYRCWTVQVHMVNASSADAENFRCISNTMRHRASKQTHRFVCCTIRLVSSTAKNRQIPRSEHYKFNTAFDRYIACEVLIHMISACKHTAHENESPPISALYLLCYHCVFVAMRPGFCCSSAHLHTIAAALATLPAAHEEKPVRK